MFRISSDSACETTNRQQGNRESLEEESHLDQSPVEEANQQKYYDEDKKIKVTVPAGKGCCFTMKIKTFITLLILYIHV